jgi:hypothetical protein
MTRSAGSLASLLVSALVMNVLACGDDLGEGPDFAGRVAAINPGGETMLVTPVEFFTWESDADSVVLRPEGAVIRVQGPDGSGTTGSVADIVVGADLRVWTSGVELRSYPGQYPARRIELLGTGSPQ